MTLHHPFLLKTTEQRDRKLVKGALMYYKSRQNREGGWWLGHFCRLCRVEQSMSAVKRWLGIFRRSMQGEESGEGGAGVGNSLQIPQLIMNERPPDGLTILGVRCGK